MGGARMRARGRRSAFGEERTSSGTGAGRGDAQRPLGFWDAGDVIWGGSGGGGGGGQGFGRPAAVTKGGRAFGKQYHARRAGGTFSAKGTRYTAV